LRTGISARPGTGSVTGIRTSRLAGLLAGIGAGLQTGGLIAARLKTGGLGVACGLAGIHTSGVIAAVWHTRGAAFCITGAHDLACDFAVGTACGVVLALPCACRATIYASGPNACTYASLHQAGMMSLAGGIVSAG
jgi:hypothetical protein